MEGLHTGFTDSGSLYGVGGMMCSVQEKSPTVMLKPCQPLGTLQGVDKVLTYVGPEMGKRLPVS